MLFPFFLSAQINESDSLNFKVDLSLSGFWQTGNVETVIFRANSNISYRPLDKLVFKSSNSYVYQEFGNAKADEDILSLNFLYFNPERRLYPQLIGFLSTNFRREIDLRYLLGAGLTYQVLKKKKDWLKISISSEYEHTDFARDRFNTAEYNGSPSINTMRATFWANGKYHVFKNKMIVTHETYFQPSLSRSDNFRWRADLNLEFPIAKYLNFKVNYLHFYESVVIEGQVREDQFLTFGFVLKRY